MYSFVFVRTRYTWQPLTPNSIWILSFAHRKHKRFFVFFVVVGKSTPSWQTRPKTTLPQPRRSPLPPQTPSSRPSPRTPWRWFLELPQQSSSSVFSTSSLRPELDFFIMTPETSQQNRLSRNFFLSELLMLLLRCSCAIYCSLCPHMVKLALHCRLRRRWIRCCVTDGHEEKAQYMYGQLLTYCLDWRFATARPPQQQKQNNQPNRWRISMLEVDCWFQCIMHKHSWPVNDNVYMYVSKSWENTWFDLIQS